MATFFGGKNFTKLEIKQQVFTPSNMQQFDIYTVPAGHHAYITMAHIGLNALTSIEYEIRHYTNRKQFPSFATGIIEEVVSLDGGGGVSTLKNGQIQMFEGEKLRFESGTNTNIECQYYITIEVYKNP